MIDQSQVLSITPFNKYAVLYKLLSEFDSKDLIKWAKQHNATCFYMGNTDYLNYEFILVFSDKESFVQFALTCL